jgi:hypothetical protein
LGRGKCPPIYFILIFLHTEFAGANKKFFEIGCIGYILCTGSNNNLSPLSKSTV